MAFLITLTKGIGEGRKGLYSTAAGEWLSQLAGLWGTIVIGKLRTGAGAQFAFASLFCPWESRTYIQAGCASFLGETLQQIWLRIQSTDNEDSLVHVSTVSICSMSSAHAHLSTDLFALPQVMVLYWVLGIKIKLLAEG